MGNGEQMFLFSCIIARASLIIISFHNSTTTVTHCICIISHFLEILVKLCWLAGPSGLWPDSLTGTNSTLPNFQWSKNLLTCGKFLECDKATPSKFFKYLFFALSHSKNLPHVSKFLDHWKFGKVEFVLVEWVWP